MLCDNDVTHEHSYHHGLDSDRDTEAEVEAILRVFPKVLSRQKVVIVWNENKCDDDDYDYKCQDEELFYPIQLLAFNIYYEEGLCCWRRNLNAVSFIPVVARLAVEFGLFEEEERGGLLCLYNSLDTNVLQHLMRNEPTTVTSDQQHNELVDDKYLLVMKQLKQMEYFKKEDIKKHGLLKALCQSRQEFFAEKRFRFLVEWDPTALLHTHAGYLPLHLVAMYSMQGFRLLLEYGIRYYPRKKGIFLLFQNYSINGTPFQIACIRYGCEEVRKVVEETLIRYSDTTPINITEALIMAAIDENIHLDCVYFLLRRQPDILNKLSSSSSSTSVVAPAEAAGTTTTTNNNNNNFKSKLRKRKRGS
jgi:hypothetical protein